MDLENAVIAVIGLGYVGLPLAIEFGKKKQTIGFDINQSRVTELLAGEDKTLEVGKELLSNSKNIKFTHSVNDLIAADIYVVTVPTPIDKHKKPDLTPLIKASEMLAKVITKGNIVIYESTVYPGATEEVCVPILEEQSGLTFNQDFFAGYSPERINPGDSEHRVTNILKVTSGSNHEIAEVVDQLYKQIIAAGTFKAASIKVAEAAKVIENTQRDVNIALINELAMIFNRMGIDTQDVLDAAGTKWNFLPFRPGLVGGHCIGVDPYYLMHKAEEIGYHPQMILAGRRINDNMGKYVATELIKSMLDKGININGANVLILGLTFKENCPDIRNTKVVDIIAELKQYHLNVDVYDPWVNDSLALDLYRVELIKQPRENYYDAVILAVAHDKFKIFDHKKINQITKAPFVVYDLKYFFPRDISDIRI